MKEQLTIEHLAPYLPYGLEYQLCGNFPIKKDEENIIKSTHLLSFHNMEKLLSWETCKPILRPLSDLTKEIEHNGKKLVPADILFDMTQGVSARRNYKAKYNHEKIRYEYPDFKWRIVDVENNYKVIKQLHKWHFDTQGLIEKGLAIDKNTLS